MNSFTVTPYPFHSTRSLDLPETSRMRAKYLTVIVTGDTTFRFQR